MRNTFIVLILAVLCTNEEIFGFEKITLGDIHRLTRKCFKIQRVYLDYTYYAHCKNTGFTALSTLPKNTTRLTFVLNHIPILNEPRFSNFTLLTYLNLQNNSIEVVQSQAFMNLTKIEDIILSKNLIAFLDINLFKHTPFLKYLDLSFNRINLLLTVSNAISRLSRIEKVILSYNVAMVIVDHIDLSPLSNSSLSYLNLESCRLTKIASGAFSHLPKLTHLFLSSNPLTEDQVTNAVVNISTKFIQLEISNINLQKLPTLALKYLTTTSIKSLNLYGNNISKLNIQANEILTIPSLLVLDLGNCSIDRIEAGTFKNLVNLQELYLQNNKLRGVEKNVFTIPTLRKLNLSNNKNDLTSYDPFYLGKNNFLNATALDILDLNDLKILVLERGALYGLVNLHELLIERSLIEIESFAFESLTTLKFLYLSENYLTFLRKDTFYGLSNLTYLTLHQNKLTLLSDFLHFNHLHKLEILDLTENEIENMPRHDLTVLPNIKYLFLTNNKIVPWNEQIITDVNTHLRSMYLTNNKLNFITSAMLTDFNLLHSVELFLNPINCSDCRISDFAYWLNTTNTFTYSPKLIRCEYPKKYYRINGDHGTAAKPLQF